MDQLIWFSMPGAVCVLALWLCVPGFGSIDHATAIALLPITGFFAHQAFRMLFELFNGWESPRRPVISEIMARYNLGNDSRTAFLIWEATFYGEKIPAAFQTHDRGAWHYVMSFWSVALAAFVAAFFVAGAAVYQAADQHLLAWTALLLLTALIFVVKGALTVSSLCRQECVIFEKYNKEFETTALTLKRGANSSVAADAQKDACG